MPIGDSPCGASLLRVAERGSAGALSPPGCQAAVAAAARNVLGEAPSGPHLQSIPVAGLRPHRLAARS